MNSIYRWLSPFVLAVVITAGIRLITDISSSVPFWDRSLFINLKDFLVAVVTCYIFDWIFRYFFRLKKIKQLDGKSVFYEYLIVTSFLLIGINLSTVIAHYLIDTPNYLIDFVISNVVAIPLGLFYYTMIRHDETRKDYINQTLQLEMVKQQQLESELNFLKAQYHPHFLFNALNTIYFQVDEENSTAKHTIELLSDLLRYQLYENKQEVAIQQEIDYIESYIQLQKLRMSERLSLEYYFDPQLREQKIHPLLLQPLLENAFKHIGGDYRINILARWEDDWIKFSVENSATAVPQDNEERKGIGIENIRRKLTLLYPDRHSLVISRDDNHFFVELSIKPSSL